jgi:hypothetical protein
VARKKRCKIFVSYSRHDESLVRPLASLLGVAVDDAVFLDVTSLKPGTQWEAEITGAIKESSVFIVCWCCESQQSAFVANEIRIALRDRTKRLVPVLFCSTPLPRALAKRQWIDLRGRLIHECNKHPHVRQTIRTQGGATVPPRMTRRIDIFFTLTVWLVTTWKGFLLIVLLIIWKGIADKIPYLDTLKLVAALLGTKLLFMLDHHMSSSSRKTTRPAPRQSRSPRNAKADRIVAKVEKYFNSLGKTVI